MSETTTTLAPAPDSFIAFARKHRETLLASGRPEDSVKLGIKEIAEKCGYDCDYGVVAVTQWSPAGGAQSFADYDAYLKAARAESYVYEQTYRFKDIADNIFNAPDLSLPGKLDKLVAAARELRTLLAPDTVNESAEEGFMERRLKAQASGPLAEAAGTPAIADYRADLPGTFATFKEADGRLRWLTIHTNTIKDGHNEAFTLQAHKDYEALVDETQEFPSLRVWHIPGTDFGKADLVTVTDDGFVMASGLIDAGKEQYVEELKELEAVGIELGCSHGFKYLERDVIDGVFHRYKSFEISVLPRARAANEYTLFATKEGTPMDATKRSFLEKVVGVDEFSQIEKALQSVASKAKESGMTVDDQLTAFKSILEGQKDEAPAPPPAPEAPTHEAPPTPDLAAQLGAAISAGIAEAMTPYAAALTAIQEQVKELGQSEDERIAAKMSSARNTGMTDLKTPTNDPGNIAQSNDAMLKIVQKDAAGSALPAELNGMKEHLAQMGLLKAAN